MKRIISLLLCMLLFSTAGVRAESGETGQTADKPAVLSYDFDLRFKLEAESSSFGERKYLQGYKELFDALEIKGNYSYCPETDCLDLNFRLIPVSDPEAALEFRIFGWVANWLNVSSPLLGDKAVCFQPKDMLNFSIRAWDFFRIPLFHFAVLAPGVLQGAWTELAENWWNETDSMRGNTLTVEAMDRIVDGLRRQFDHDERVTKLVEAATKSVPDDELVNNEISRLPDLLPVAADGQKLTRKTENAGGTETIRWLNHRGETIYQSIRSDLAFEETLTLPGSASDYMPAYSFSREETEKDYSIRLDVSWDRVSEDEDLLDTLLRIKADLQHVPKMFPADAEFSGEMLTEGVFFPNFHYLISGITGTDGTVRLMLKNPDGETDFTLTGIFTPVPYEGTLEYMIGEIITDYSLFALTDETLGELQTTMVPAMMETLPDFVYAIPTHSIQSILDTLEKYGLLQIALQ